MGTSTTLAPDSLRYAPYSLIFYVRDYGDYLGAERFSTMPTSGDARKMYGGGNSISSGHCT